MNWLITGLNGTLAPVLARRAAAGGVDVLAWDRHRVPPDDAGAADAWLQAQRPDAIAHLGMGSPDWAARLARHAAAHGRPFVFTSSAMVFHHLPDGPHAPDDERTAQDPYGRYKIACEDAVRAANPDAGIVRIGWQIDPARPGNNMLMALDRMQAAQGFVAASRAWTPACSFMEDTAEVLVRLLQRPVAGVLHFDSNAEEAHSFADIVVALKQTFGRSGWDLRTDDAYAHDQRLVGSGVISPPLEVPLSARLPGLKPRGGGGAHRAPHRAAP